MTSHDSEPTSVRPLTGPEIDAVRADFPYLKRPARNGEPLAYLDWAATSQKPSCVMTREAEFLSLNNGAAGRSTYQIADEATQAWEDAREAVAGFVGARGGQPRGPGLRVGADLRRRPRRAGTGLGIRTRPAPDPGRAPLPGALAGLNDGPHPRVRRVGRAVEG